MSKQARSEHVPLFPSYVRQLPDRTLCFYDQERNEFVTEHDSHFRIHDDDFPAFLDLLFEQNLLVFTDNLLQFPFSPDCIEKWPQPCRPPTIGGRITEPISLNIKSHGKRYHVVQTDSWELPRVHNPQVRRELLEDFLKVLRETYKLCEVGTPGTPGGLGQALMRRSWLEQFGQEWYKHRHVRPNMGCVRDLLEHGTGGRVDTPKMGEHLDMIQERDIKNAYASCYIRQPDGTAVRTFGHPNALAGFVTYFARCSVTIHSLLPLGPFPIRRLSASGLPEPYYPREPGEYTAYLWKEEIEDCLKSGCSVEIGEGWGWERWTYDNAAWVDLMARLRDAAHGSVADKLKLSIVAGIGRHGMGETMYTLVGKDHADLNNDIQVCDQESHESVELWIHATKQNHFSNMTHWYAYTMMLCRHILYQDMLPHAVDETLVSSNYDAYYVTTTQEGPQDLEVKLIDGEYQIVWKTKTLHAKKGKAPVPYPRALDTVEKTRMPGVPRAKPLQRNRHTITNF